MERTEAVISRLRTIQADAIAYAATGDIVRRGEFEDMATLLDAELNALADLVRDNPVQVRRMSEFAASVREEYAESLHLVQDRRKSGSRPTDMPDIGVTKIRGLSGSILVEENRLLNERNLDSARSALITRSIAAAALLVSLLALALAYWLVLLSHREEQVARARLNDANLRLNQSLADARDMSETMSKLATFGELLHGCQTLDEVREGIGKSLGGLLPQLGGRMALINPSQNLASIGAHWGRHGLLAESVFAPEDCWALRRGQAYPLAVRHRVFRASTCNGRIRILPAPVTCACRWRRTTRLSACSPSMANARRPRTSAASRSPPPSNCRWRWRICA
jgi:hypothetical protein